MIAALLMAAALPAPAPVIDGVWHNPSNSVAVRTGPCGAATCGWVVRASAAAEADAKRGSGAALIGVALLRDYKPSGHNVWSGTLFVPDMGRSFDSTITLADPQTIRVKGCLMGRFLCKTQLWRRD
ncbi:MULTISPECIES: DUF2147 domain-containing protein [unclassified Sphingomonas]|uniref:DUF2147 domain-containing protein n=1 Tax=unclassified Sphingomonas TaxID=196159 RepID=UPI001F5832AD|nr:MULTISPECIES: DUF2147 domain-containing protein [unclassified Sphingomonas]